MHRKAALTDFPERVADTAVVRLSLPRFALQSRLDDIGGRREVRRRHTGDGGSRERLAVREDLAVTTFVEDVLLEVSVAASTITSQSELRACRRRPFRNSRREVDGGEGHVSREAGSGTAVQSE